MSQPADPPRRLDAATDPLTDPGGTPRTDSLRAGLARPDAVLLRLQLIGRMQATTLANESVLPLGRKTRGLLAILALSGRRPVLRSKLAELLWSRRSEEQARASLRQEIHRLLDALAPLGVDVITVERHMLALKPALTSVDTDRILHASPNQIETLPPMDGVLLEELSGTDPALDEWLETERRRLREHALSLFEGVLRRQREGSGAMAAARQLLLLDRLHDTAWRTLIRGQLQAGERSLALDTAERCLQAFAERPDSEPSAETRRLLADLRNGAADGAGWAPPDANETGAQADAGAARPVRRPHEGAAANHPGDGRPRLAILPLLDLDSGSVAGNGSQALGEEFVSSLSSGLTLAVANGTELQASLAGGRDDELLHRSFGIDYVLDGTIQTARPPRGSEGAPPRTRVILRLTDIRPNGHVVWAHRIDSDAPDRLAMQDEVRDLVRSRLFWEVALAESRQVARRPIAELDPYCLSIRALPLLLRLDRTQNDRAGELLRQALQRDPDAALANAMAACRHLIRLRQHWGSRDEEAAQAQTLSRRAVALNGTDSFVLAVAALVTAEAEDAPEQALSLLERAAAQAPGSATVPAGLSVPLLRLGRLDKAARCFNRYKHLNPTHPFEVMLDGAGVWIALLQGDDALAVSRGRTLCELQPGVVGNVVPFLAALGHLRRDAEADRMRARLRAVLPDGVEALVAASGLRRPEDRARLAEGLRLAGLPDGSSEPARLAG